MLLVPVCPIQLVPEAPCFKGGGSWHVKLTSPSCNVQIWESMEFMLYLLSPSTASWSGEYHRGSCYCQLRHAAMELITVLHGMNVAALNLTAFGTCFHVLCLEHSS